MKKQRVIWLGVIAAAGIFLLIRNFTGWPWQGAMTSKTIDSFDSVVMDLSDADLVIEEGSQFELSFENIKENQIEWSVDDGELFLSEEVLGNPFFSFNSKRRVIVLTVPRKTSLKNLELSTEDSDVVVGNLSAEKITMELSDGDLTLQQLAGQDMSVMTGDGDVYVEDINVKNIEMESNDGDFYFNKLTSDSLFINMADGDLVINDSTIGKLQHDGNSGDIAIDHSKISESFLSVADGDFAGNEMILNLFEFNSDDGDFLLGVEGKRKDYELDLDSDDGDILLDGQAYRGKSSQGSKQDNRIIVYSGDGDILVNFNH